MKLYLQVVGTQEQIADVLLGMAHDLTCGYTPDNARTMHENGADSDFDFTDGKEIGKMKKNEKEVKPEYRGIK